MAQHSDMGPSGAGRWMSCTASVQAIRDLRARDALPEKDDDGSAAEGTAAHAVRETALREGTSPFDQIGRVITVGAHTFTVDEHMADDLVAGIDWMRERVVDIEVELRVRLDPWMPNQFGTLDAGGQTHRTGILIINDFKYGIGNIVKAERNKQVMLYALGYWHRIGRPIVDKVWIVIDQPRRGGMKFWETTIDELLDFGEQVSDVFMDIQAGRVEYRPSEEACQFCPVKDTPEGCAAFDRFFVDLLRKALDPVADLIGGPRFRDPDRITPEERWIFVRHANELKNWVDSLKQKSLAAAHLGAPDPGSKLIESKRGRRSYGDPDKADEILSGALGLDAYKPLQLIGITDAQKLLKPGVRKEGHPEAWAALEAILDHGDPEFAVVPEDDPRPEYTDPADIFDDL